MGWSSVVSLIGTSIGILAILISYLKQKGSYFKKSAFLIMLSSLTYYCLMVWIVDSGVIVDFPHFYKTGSPFFYLLPISILWVSQAYLFGKEKLEKWDYLLLLIPIVHLIEYIPFYLQPSKEKVQYLQSLILDRDQIVYANEGLIPTSFHFALQLSFGLVISLYLLKIIRDQKLKDQQSNPVLSWLNVLAGVFLIFYLIGLSLLIFDSDNLPIHQLASWLFGLMMVAQLFFLFFRPEVLYGIYAKQEAKALARTLHLEEEEEDNYRSQIEEYFKMHDDFLNAEFRQQNLADHMGIPKNRLSQIINQLFNQNFNQLVNEKRIEIAIEKIQSNVWKNLTIEGIAQEVGFKSRTTFNKAFQEKTGLTPSQFRKKI